MGTVDLANHPMQNLLGRIDDVSRRTLDHLDSKDQPKNSSALRACLNPLKANVDRYERMGPPFSKPLPKSNLGNFNSGKADLLRDLYNYKEQMTSEDATKMPELILDRNYPLRRLLADTTGPKNYHQVEIGSGVDASKDQDREQIQTGKHFGGLYISSNEQVRITTTVCLRSTGPFYVVTYCIKWFTTSWTYSIFAIKD